MFDLLELLFDYSINHKRVDSDFFDHVLSFYWNGLKNYLEHVSYASIEFNKKKSDSNMYSPMGYSFYRKTLVIDDKVINANFFKEMLYFQRLGFGEFSRIFCYNVKLLYSLLHEIDHSTQYKKGIEDKDSFEGLLLNLCFYPEMTIQGKVSFIDILLRRYSLSKLLPIAKDLKDVNISFFRDVPYERLAEIDSCKQIVGLLEVFNTELKKIPDELNYFKRLLFKEYQVGYNNSQKESAPLIRYIEEIKKLNYAELNKIINDLESKYSEITVVDDRARFGLDITSKEFNDLKKRVLR